MVSCDNKKISSLLDYWFAIEFLSQDSFEVTTSENMLRREAKRYKELVASGQRRKQLTDFIGIDLSKALYKSILDEANSCKMRTWGNITVYLGKIERESCIVSLAKYLNIDDISRPEKNYDNIAVLSFQLGQQGNYIEHSLSLSTIVWAISKLESSGGNSASSDILSEEEYKKDMASLEKEFFGSDDGGLFEQVGEMIPPVFNDDSVTSELIQKIYGIVHERYVADKIDSKMLEASRSDNAYCGIRIQYFTDNESKNKDEDDNYQGLSRDYFSDDIKLVRDYYLKNPNTGNNKNEMISSLKSYICAPGDDQSEYDNRIDLIHPPDKKEYEKKLLEILHIKHSPLGKWPARYMPTLMQQIAINLSLAGNTDKNFGENGAVFSVNGPPGTGKTTLLKEIVANNIVEKARLLSNYEDPDNAFIDHEFLKGEKVNNSYSKFHRRWYSLKDDRINNYSLLLASCNNAAVENITKELPMERGIQDGLKIFDSDDSCVKKQLAEVKKLFSLLDTEQKEHLKNGPAGENDYAEIYFSAYSQKLFGNDAWGLIAAPLGKKSNLKQFYDNVLYPLHWDYYGNNDSITARKEKFKEIRKVFSHQLRKVENLRKSISKYCDSAVMYLKRCEEYGGEIEACEKEIEILECDLSRIESSIKEKNDKLKQIRKTMSEAKNDLEDATQKYRSIKQTRESIDSAIEEEKKKIYDIESSVGFFSRLLRTSKYRTAIDLIGSYKNTILKHETSKELFECDLRAAEQGKENKEVAYENAYAILKDSEVFIEELHKKKKAHEEIISFYAEKINTVNVEIAKITDRHEALMKECIEGSGNATVHGAGIIDETYIDSILSNDREESTDAQVRNPWLTDYYNREREKLLYYSLQLTREFVLSAKPCRENFALLGQYWGYRAGDDNERIKFDISDRENMVPALYQSLLLLVPVVSSTFASMGRWMKDIKSKDTIGMLIVDEAGQAQPQMALGALFRSRSAIIVGDPKQVEPVVTDDLELLKKTFSDRIYTPYKDKNISVQRAADIINPYGTYLQNGTDYPDWVGCPLLVHRRCINPMYDISNRISYAGIMKKQTPAPSAQKEKNFIFSKSQWINVGGKENGKKDHYVSEQGEKVCKMLDIAFKKNQQPNLYIISPFTSVVNGMRKGIKSYVKNNPSSYLASSNATSGWIYSNIGTVHTFQGKEADEVIFLLGCDKEPASAGAISWVNSNIVNVAVTRAKYRLYVIGDIKAWDNNAIIGTMKTEIDVDPFIEIGEIARNCEEPAQANEAYKEVASRLTSASSLIVRDGTGEEGDENYSIRTDGFVGRLEERFNEELSEGQLKRFGFNNKSEFDKLDSRIKKDIRMGIKLYYLLEPVFLASNELDASCCGILFCKALELQLGKNFLGGLKAKFPDFKIKKNGGNMALEKAQENDFMIGTVRFILNKKIGSICASMNEKEYGINWWKSFNDRLKKCADRRNKCCHKQLFKWQDLKELIKYEFEYDNENDMDGVFFASSIGNMLNK